MAIVKLYSKNRWFSLSISRYSRLYGGIGIGRLLLTCYPNAYWYRWSLSVCFSRTEHINYKPHWYT